MTDMVGALGKGGKPDLPAIPADGGLLAVTGPVLVALPCLLVAYLGFVNYASHGTAAATGIALGAAGFAAMAEALILAARPRLLEPLFGGLDRMYSAHKWLGIAALLLMILHDRIDPDFDRAMRETALGDGAKDLGELAFNVLLVLVAVSWFRRLPLLRLEIPYQLWRFSHRFLGVLFAMVAFHQAFVDMPAGVKPSLALVLNGFAIAGLVAWVHTEFLAPRLRRRAFTVGALRRRGDTTLVTLRPARRGLRWRPGQFAFFSAPEAGLSEPHPFTIASAPRPDGSLTIAVRALGGWTRRLPLALREGMTVRVEGPYGRFDFRKGDARQVWLAGGIGITPFLAWAESLTASDERWIHLVHCVGCADEAAGIETLRAAAARNPRFSFEVVATAADGRLTAGRLVRSTPFPVAGSDLWFCGPTGFRDAIVKGLSALGQRPRRIRFEHFNFA